VTLKNASLPAPVGVWSATTALPPVPGFALDCCGVNHQEEIGVFRDRPIQPAFKQQQSLICPHRSKRLERVVVECNAREQPAPQPLQLRMLLDALHQ